MFRLFAKMPYYSVARGRQTGVFQTWSECESHVKGFSGATYKKFNTLQEAQSFAANNSGGSSVASSGAASYSYKRPASTYVPTYCEPAAKKAKSTLPSNQYAEDNAMKASYGNNDFIVDKDGFVQVYTDGSCENNGRKNASAGLGVYFDDNHPLNQAEPVKGPPTNNRGEIQAASKAIELSAKSNVKKVCINTDSQFLIDSATKWMKGWKAKGWKLSSGKPVKNENDFRELDRVVNSNPDVEVKWTYVPAHSGIPGNEHADTLAKQGAQKYKNERN